MKKIRVILIALFILLSGSAFQQAVAQDKTFEEQQREQMIQKAIDEQKRALADQKKAQEEGEYQWEEQSRKLEDIMNDFNNDLESVERNREKFRFVRPGGSRLYSIDEPFTVTPGTESFYYHPMGGSERTTWDFSRSVKENTFTKVYSFEVEKTARSVVMSVMGDCKAGEIRISIMKPDGEKYSDIVIDEFGNLNWRKSFNISETENQDKTGVWKFQMRSDKATGYFKISIQSN